MTLSGAVLSGCSLEVNLEDFKSLFKRVSVEIYSDVAQTNNKDSIPITLTFSEDLENINADDLIVHNGAIRDFVGSGRNYSFWVDVDIDGPVSVIFASKSVEVNVENKKVPTLTNSASADFIVNRTPLSATLSLSTASPSLDPIFKVHVVFNRSVTGLSVTDFTVVSDRGGSGYALPTLSGSGNSYVLTYNAITSGDFYIQLPAGVVSDQFGNKNAVSSTLEFVYDSLMPKPVLSTVVPLINNLSIIPITLDFNVDVIGVVVGDFQVINGTVESLSGSNKNYELKVSPASDGPIEVRYLENRIQSALGSWNLKSNVLQFEVDRVAPTLSLTGGSPAKGNRSSSFQWTVTYSDYSQIDLSEADIAVVGAGITCATPLVSGTGDIRTITLTGCNGSGSLQISLATGTARDRAGNLSLSSELSNAVTIDNEGPTVVIGSVSQTVGNKDAVFTWGVSFTDAQSVSLSKSQIVMTGASVGCLVSVAGSGAQSRTVSITGCTGDGSLSFSIAANSAKDDVGNSNDASTESIAVSIDNVAPALILGAPSPTSGNRYTTFTWPLIYSGADSITLNESDIEIIGTGALGCSISISGSGLTNRLVAVQNCSSGSGNLEIRVKPSTSRDLAGNLSNGVTSSTNVNIDNINFIVGLTSIVPPLNNRSTIPVVVTFSAPTSDFNASQLQLVNAMITNLVGHDREYAFDLVPLGDGMVSVFLPPAQVRDGLGNLNLASNSLNFTIDTIKPTVIISNPVPLGGNRNSSISWLVTLSGADSIDLDTSNVFLVGASQDCTLPVISGSGNSRTVTVTGCTGEGNLSLSIDAGAGTDQAGNQSDTAVSVVGALVDNTAPTIDIGAPTPSVGNLSTEFSWVLTYASDAIINLDSSYLNLQGATTGCSTPVVSGTELTRTVSVQGCSGNGTLQMNILAGSAVDPFGNVALAVGPSLVAMVDNTPPTLMITNGSPSKGNSSSVFRWTLSYSGEEVIHLNSSMISLVGASQGCGSPIVSGSGSVRTVSVTSCSGNGELSISVEQGSASDAAGNLAALNTSSSFIVDNQGPALSISGPSPALGNKDTVFEWEISYTDADVINLDTVVLQGAVEGCIFDIRSGGTNLRKVTVTECSSSSGALGILVPADSARDDIGNISSAMVSSGSATLDNVGPSLAISAPIPLLGNKNNTFQFIVNYLEAVQVVLNSGHVSLTGNTAGCTVVVNNIDLSKSIIFIENCSGDGNLGISIAAGVAKDSLGNSSIVTASTTSAIVDNTPPSILVTGPSPSQGSKTQSFIWSAAYSGASTVTLNENDVIVSYSGTVANCQKTIGGTGDYKTITVTNCSGDGSITLSIAANSAEDAAGNKALAVNPPGQATVDNTPPVISFSSPNPSVSSVNEMAIWNISYTGASSINLTTSHIVFLGDDIAGCTASIVNGTTANPRVGISGCTSYANDSISFKINGGTALDSVGNIASETVNAPPARIINALAIGFENYTDYSTMETSNQNVSVVLAAPAPKDVFINYYVNTIQTTVNHDISQMGTLVIPQGSARASIPVTISKNPMSLGSKILQMHLTQSTQTAVNLDLQRSITRIFLQDTINTDKYIKVSRGSVTCGILENGTLKCWGANSNGNVGDGTRIDVKTAKVINSGVSYTDVSVGMWHSCGIASGMLKCWGSNGQAQFGDGGSTDSLTPKNIGNGYVSVSAGTHHTCAITTASQLRCWGYNAYGQIGDGTKGGYVMTPKLIDSGTAYKQVSSSMYNTCGLTTSGVVKCWGSTNAGDGSSNQYAVPTVVDAGTIYSSISTNAHMCGLTSSGTIKCWGFNGAGQIGDGTSNNQASTPKIADGGNLYTSVVTGGNHTCGLTATGVLKCWGGNSYGDLGDGTKIGSIVPKVVDNGISYSFIAEGATCGVTVQGYLKCWGDFSTGNVGDGSTYNSTTPRLIDTGIGYSSIQAKGYLTCGRTLSGLAKCWGTNGNGQMGMGTEAGIYTAKAISPGYTYSEVSSGAYHSCFIETGGALRCSGYNYYGQVGDGTTTQINYRKYVDTGVTYKKVQMGDYHTCGVTTDDVLKCWGSNSKGQLGDNSLTQSLLPKNIDSGVSYRDIALGVNHTCGITTAGVLKCWGLNLNGQVGDGSTVDVLSPKVIDAGVSYAMVSAAASHTCAVTTAGVLKCWGINSSGQLGDNTTSQSTVPKVINAGAAYKSVATAINHSCGILTTGALRCWGSNALGSLGDGTTTQSNVPKVIDNGVTYTSISTGATHTCGVTTIGWVKCWGGNSYQQLGLGGSLFGLPSPMLP